MMTGRYDDMDPVVIRMRMDTGGDKTKPMPRKVAREIVKYLIPIGLFRWDPFTRTFGTGLTGGHQVRWAIIEDA